MWQRYNGTTKIFEKSTDNGGSWAPLGLDAAIITQGTVADARLSANIPKLNAANVFTALNTFAKTNIGGQITHITTQNGDYAMYLTNLSATGYGLTIQAGNGITSRSLDVNNYNGTVSYFYVRGDGLVAIPTLTGATFVAGDKYLVINASGQIHRSALGPAS